MVKYQRECIWISCFLCIWGRSHMTSATKGGRGCKFLIFSDKGGTGGGLAVLLFFLTRGEGRFSIFWPVWLSLKIMQECQDFYCFSLNMTSFQIFFSLKLYFSYFFLFSICVNNFHMHTSSLEVWCRVSNVLCSVV